jgi:Protein of unknown function (DUF3800)
VSVKHQKLYAYVDESGQDTNGEMFLVSVVVISSKRDALRELLRDVETKSRKHGKKWSRTVKDRRVAYIKHIIDSKEFIGLIYYSHYKKARVFIDLTVLSTAKAILDQAKQPYDATVYVDGLTKHDRKYFTKGLRKLQVKTDLARGLTDEADEFIRLADAIAGFVRDGTEGEKTMKPLYKKALQRGVIREA